MAKVIWEILMLVCITILNSICYSWTYTVETRILKGNDSISGSISHFVFDSVNNVFYVGAVNRIFRLSPSLEIQHQVDTGPVLDNVLCSGNCDYDKVSTDNYNKILLIEKNRNGNNRLVVCGSLYQGYCEFRDLPNIEHKIFTGNHTKLVANAGNATTVGLIVDRGLTDNVIYIGASFPISVACSSGPVFDLFRAEVPAISMRKLSDSPFSLYQRADDLGRDTASSLKIKNELKRKYIIDFVSAFTLGNYSYFLTVQPVFKDPLIDNCMMDKKPVLQSKISLICHRDIHFYSYVDIPLHCSNNNAMFSVVKTGRTIIPGSNLKRRMGISSDILVALFQKHHDDGRIDSAVCVYSMSDIQKIMRDNLKSCYDGNSSYRGDNKFADGASCPRTQGITNVDLCNTITKSYGRVSGVKPVESKPAIVFLNTTLTSLTLTVTTNNTNTVGFLGTSNGHLKKIVIENKTSAREYDEDLVVDQGSPINQDTVYDAQNRQLYLTSQNLVAKVAVENCRQYTSCTSCLASRDPFCGWCTLENSCTLMSECSMSHVSPDRWKKGIDGKECTAIDSITPPQASSTENIILYLSIIDIPRATNYSCVFDFGEKKQMTRVIPWNFGVSCNTPDIRSLGVYFGPTGSINATLSIRSEETHKLFVSKKFTFYNCGSFSSCTSCTDNFYACDWCTYENKCTFRKDPCSSETIVSRNVDQYDPDNFTKTNNYSDGIRRGPTFCPRILVNKNSTDLYIHDGTRQNVTIRASYLPEVRSGSSYRCVIKAGYGNEDIIATALRKSETELTCVVPLKHYNLPRVGKLEADLTVTWGEGGQLESDGAKVIIYSCSVMAQGDCSLCESFEVSQPALRCRWCDSPSQCKYRDHCAASSPIMKCPAPQIYVVTPLKGHYLGGTIVTIKGRNLGVKVSDILNNVTIAGVACKPVPELYKPAREIVCRLESSDNGLKSGPVVVLNIPFSKFQFQYQKPVLEVIKPSQRALSGGALVTMYGNPVYTGTSVIVTFNDKECIITSKSEKKITCRIPASVTGKAKVSIKIDGNEITQKMGGNIIISDKGQEIYGNTSFYYVADPTIEDIFPRQSFRSGGRRITVKGTHINVIDHPKMFITVNSIKSNETDCKVKNSTHMTCPTPSLPLTESGYNRHRRAIVVDEAKVGFEMDNVPNIDDAGIALQYFPDPEVEMFEPVEKIFKSEILIILGKNLMLAAKREDIQVYVGNGECNVTNLSEDQIVCNPPTTQPSPVSHEGLRSDIPAVMVYIGNRNYFVGYLKYESPSLLGIPIEYIIAGVSGVGLFIIVTIIACICIYKRQKNKSKRDCEKMRYQLDNLESNVRNECKQAFAELQTDMTDLTAEIGDGKKPLYRYDDYTFKILFPQMLDHVVLHPPIPKNGSNERHPDVAICHFSQLLQNKQFLLKFIRTLEKQKSFGIRDKSNVASLLIILYQNNLEYITEIIKALLKELVEKSVEGKHPKLMLRRTESVVEKLLANWLALCMYKNLEESTGSSLYLLYQAIKFQVMKGPVDAVTGDARYSLSEDRLLRTENRLEPVSLTLNVEYEGKKYKCRCLDCDTISQAKEKMLDSIYRNIPYTTRPAAEDLDLDWVNENKTLQDEDNLKYKDNGWKQFNMLKDYKIPNGADVVLTQYQKCRTLPRSPNGSVHSSGFSYNKEAVPITRTDSEVGTKYWHLVKQHDDAQAKGLSSEIFLTRLLATKGTLKQYIDDFIRTVLTASPNMMPVIKYLFDFLDDAARQYNITDPEVAYTWKCNSLLLRFWVNIIKNPDFVFDIHKTNIVDSCLSVVAQCFMDSCSTSDQNLSKDSPSNKLLFAKDIPVFKKWVSKYFEDIQRMPAVSDQDLNAYLAEVSRMSTNYFTKDNALFELYNYVQKYSNEINESLEADSFTKAQQLPDRLGNVITNMEGPSNVALAYV